MIFLGGLDYYEGFDLMEQITIYPSEELLEKLRFEAMAEERSLNNLILKILKKEFKE